MIIDFNQLITSKEYCEKTFSYFLKKKVLKQERGFLIKYVNKSISNLEFANFILDEHKFSIKEKLPNKTFYDWVVTIYYYSIYHMALALLTKISYASKSHIATITGITLFYYHKDNILNKQDIEFLIDKIYLEKEDISLIFNSKELRETASYNVDSLFELKQAEKMQKETA